MALLDEHTMGLPVEASSCPSDIGRKGRKPGCPRAVSKVIQLAFGWCDIVRGEMGSDEMLLVYSLIRQSRANGESKVRLLWLLAQSRLCSDDSFSLEEWRSVFETTVSSETRAVVQILCGLEPVVNCMPLGVSCLASLLLQSMYPSSTDLIFRRTLLGLGNWMTGHLAGGAVYVIGEISAERLSTGMTLVSVSMVGRRRLSVLLGFSCSAIARSCGSTRARTSSGDTIC